MASRRMIPVGFFHDPVLAQVQRKETQLVLIALILCADDEGRVVANTDLLSRKVAYPVDLLEEALQELVEQDVLVLSQVGNHHYY